MHAVTTPQAFTALLAMYPSDVNLQLGSCTSGQNSQTRSAMAIVAPALNPGWYMDKFISGCD